MTTQSKERIVLHRLGWHIFTFFIIHVYPVSLEYRFLSRLLCFSPSSYLINHNIHISQWEYVTIRAGWKNLQDSHYCNSQKTQHLDPLNTFDHWLASHPLQKQPTAFSILRTSVVFWIYKNGHTWWCWQSAKCWYLSGLPGGTSPQMSRPRWATRGATSIPVITADVLGRCPQVLQDGPLWPSHLAHWSLCPLLRDLAHSSHSGNSGWMNCDCSKILKPFESKKRKIKDDSSVGTAVVIFPFV